MIGLICLLAPVRAQFSHPRSSPYQEVVQHVGLSSVGVRYSRPAVRDREVFGDLVPYGRIWRVGANESTRITLADTMRVGPNELPAGTYALYAFPQADTWEVVFHRDTTHWGDGRSDYDPQKDLFRYRVQPEAWPQRQENFLITFENITHNGMDMLWIWDRTCIRIPLEVDTPAAMERNMAEAMEQRPTAQTFYEAARYLQETGREYPRALGYIERALELGGETYYFCRVRSLILAALGAYPEAIEAARRSKALAAAEGKDEFVRMNQKNIELWTEKIE